jgi:hypothetical protein
MKSKTDNIIHFPQSDTTRPEMRTTDSELHMVIDDMLRLIRGNGALQSDWVSEELSGNADDS